MDFEEKNDLLKIQQEREKMTYSKASKREREREGGGEKIFWKDTRHAYIHIKDSVRQRQGRREEGIGKIW